MAVFRNKLGGLRENCHSFGAGSKFRDKGKRGKGNMDEDSNKL